MNVRSHISTNLELNVNCHTPIKLIVLLLDLIAFQLSLSRFLGSFLSLRLPSTLLGRVDQRLARFISTFDIGTLSSNLAFLLWSRLLDTSSSAVAGVVTREFGTLDGVPASASDGSVFQTELSGDGFEVELCFISEVVQDSLNRACEVAYVDRPLEMGHGGE